MNNETFTTKRLTLRRFTMDDCKVFHEIFSDTETMKFWSTPPHTSMDQTEKFISDTVNAVENGTGDDFVIIYENKVIGKAGLWNNEEIGFILSKDVWGQGIATEAVKAVLKRAKDNGVKIVTADVDPRNIRSLNVLRKCGFKETGRAKNTMTVAGVPVDSVYLKAYLVSS